MFLECSCNAVVGSFLQGNKMLDWFLSSGSFKGNYNFHIEVSPKVVESNSNLTITCYSNKNKGAVIPVAITWFKIKNGLSTHMASVRGNTYLCDPSDVGAVIRAEVKSLEEESGGTAVVDVGPVKIDIITKKNIESILSSGAGNFTAFMVGRSRDREQSLRIEDNLMRLKDIVTDNCYKFEYTISDPLIELHPKDNTRMSLVFSERYEEDLAKFLQATIGNELTESRRTTLSERWTGNRRVQLRFSSRTTKDMFIYSYRAFVAKRQIKTSALLNRIENLDLNKQDTFNFLMEIESLKSEIVRMVEVNKQQAREKDIYHKEIKHLEQQMERIIMTYTRIVEEKCKNQQDFNESYSVLTTKRDQIFSRKQKSLQNENRELANRINLLNDEIYQLKSQKKNVFSERYEQPSIRVTQPPILHDFSRKQMPAVDLESKVIELSRINSVLADENAKLKQGHSLVVTKEKTIDNILQSLNDSIVRDNHDKLQQTVKQLQRENISISRQLQVSNRKNEELAVALKQAELKGSSNNSQAKSVRLDINKLPGASNVVHSMYVDSSADANKLSNELHEAKKMNEKLSNENSRLQATHNADISNCQAMQLEVTRLKEEMMSASLDRSRAQFSTVVESSEIQRLRKERDQITSVKQAIEQKCDGLLIENSQLKKKINTLEFELEFQKSNAKRITDLGCSTQEMNHLKAEITSLQKQLSDKQQTIQMLEQKQKQSKLDNSKNSELSNLGRKAEELIQENKMLRKGQDVLNRSRDLSMEMDSYYEQQNNVIKQQITMLTEQNERLVKMVEKYSKQAKQTSKLRTEIIQLRSENLQLKRQLQNRSSVNPQLSYGKIDA